MSIIYPNIKDEDTTYNAKISFLYQDKSATLNYILSDLNYKEKLWYFRFIPWNYDSAF